MSRALNLLVLTLSFFCFQNCGSPFHSPDTANLSTSTSTGGSGSTLQVDQALQTQALAILTTNCASCHNTITSGGVTQILDVNHDIAVGLIVVGNPAQGTLISAIQTGGMPVGGTVSPADLTTLKNWISSMHYVAGGTTPAPAPTPVALPAGKVVIADATLHTAAMKVINTNCAGCHQGMASGGIDNILDINNLQTLGLIVAGDPTQGTLLSVIAAGTMPKGNGARVSAADVLTLKNWISSMTIVDQSLAPVPLPTRAALAPTFTGVNANIIQPKCIACHGPIKSQDVNFSTFAAVSGRKADVLSKCQSGSMPEAPYPAVTADEIAALKTWIQNGALNN